jgi:hypothetical protein
VADQVVLLDYRIGPDLPHEIILLDYPPSMTDQKEQYLERFQTERHNLTVPHQHRLFHIREEWTKLV